MTSQPFSPLGQANPSPGKLDARMRRKGERCGHCRGYGFIPLSHDVFGDFTTCRNCDGTGELWEIDGA